MQGPDVADTAVSWLSSIMYGNHSAFCGEGSIQVGAATVQHAVTTIHQHEGERH